MTNLRLLPPTASYRTARRRPDTNDAAGAVFAGRFGEAATAVYFGKTLLDPAAKLFPGHSSERD